GVQIDDASANDVMAQLLCLESTDPDRDIIMYINSPGGSFTSLTAIYDTMQFVKPEIQTVCLGQAASAAAEGGYGQSSDIEIQAREILRMRALLETLLARHTGRTEDQVRQDIERDKILTAQDAVDYGIVDEVIKTRKASR